MTPNGIVLANEPLVRMTFSPNGAHFPSSLVVGGTELMTTPQVACADESGAGISLYPATRIDGATSQGDIRIDLEGPDIAKVSIDWTASFPCDSSTGLANGRTTFVMFADGRINRSDFVAIPNQPISAECNCGGEDSWFVSSYFTFARDQLTNVVGANATAGVGSQVNGTACITGNAFQMAMAWRTGNSTRARLPLGSGSGGTIAFIENLTDPSAPPGQLPAAFEAAAQTTWWAGASSTCSDLRTAVDPYAANGSQPLPTLMIKPGASSANGYGVALDGIFGGETDVAPPGPGFPEFPLVLTTPVALAGFGFWINVNSLEIASVRKSPTDPTTPWYSVQTPPAFPTHRVLWFPDGLATDESITINLQ